VRLHALTLRFKESVPVVRDGQGKPLRLHQSQRARGVLGRSGAQSSGDSGARSSGAASGGQGSIASGGRSFVLSHGVSLSRSIGRSVGSERLTRRQSKGGSMREAEREETLGAAQLEECFDEHVARRRLAEVRLGLGCMMAFKLLLVADALSLGGDMAAAAALDLCFVTICMLALLLTLSAAFLRYMSRVTFCVYVATGVTIPITTATLRGQEVSQLTSLVLVLFFALVGNISGLNFFPACAVDGLTLLASVAVFLSPADTDGCAVECARGACAEEEGQPIYNTLFVLVSAIFSVSSAYQQARYMRRKFVLMLRLKVETARADELLYRVLPEPVVAQMKQGLLVADEFDYVFILASDIKDFTSMAAACAPADVVSYLSTLFSSVPRTHPHDALLRASGSAAALRSRLSPRRCWACAAAWTCCARESSSLVHARGTRSHVHGQGPRPHVRHARAEAS